MIEPKEIKAYKWDCLYFWLPGSSGITETLNDAKIALNQQKMEGRK